jgi:hypothetical protein
MGRKREMGGKQMNCYRRRNERLSELGYLGYRDYLKTDEWKQIRDNKLRKFPHCLICNEAATQVHHLDYGMPTLLGLHPQKLVTLCRTCHEQCEFDGDRKRTLCEANKALRQMADAAGKHRWLTMLRRGNRTKGRLHIYREKRTRK